MQKHLQNSNLSVKIGNSMKNNVINFTEKDKYSIDDLLEIMELLRSENGCMWDREQTHKSIRDNFIEEVNEAVQEIDTGIKQRLCEELGDVLLQVVFHSRIAQENNDFDFADVTDGICKKLINRHPHVFSDTKVESIEDIKSNWEKIKKDEKFGNSSHD